MKSMKEIAALTAIAAGVIVGGMLALPYYGQYQRRMGGEAQLLEAEYTKKIAVEEAKAQLEAAKLLREAEIERAKGVAEANEIIGDSLSGKEEYLRYLWIQGLQDGSSEVIYVPTEAGLPILEANASRRPGVARGD